MLQHAGIVEMMVGKTKIQRIVIQMTSPMKEMIETFLIFWAISVNYCNKYDGEKIFNVILEVYTLLYHYFISIYFLLYGRPQFDLTESGQLWEN